MIKLLPLISILIFSGCGVVKKRLQAKKKSQKVHKVVKYNFNYGPTQNKNTSFIDVTKRTGLEGFKAKRFYIVDFNNDNLEDIVLLESNYSKPIFLVNKGGRFVKTKSVFFNEEVKASFLNFQDFDGDGITDVLVAVFNQKTELTKRPIRVFKGRKNRGLLEFKEDLRYKFSSKLPVSSVSVLDYDKDGNLDFYVGTWFDFTKPIGSRIIPDKLYTFKNNQLYDISAALTGEQDYRSESYVKASPTLGVSHCDVNSDGIVDILTSSSAGNLNKLWLGEKKGDNIIFVDRGESSGFSQDDEGKKIPRGGGNSTFSICHDYNNDEIFDVVSGEVSSSYDSETLDRSSILTGRNPEGLPEFIRTEYSGRHYGAWTQSDMNGVWFDYDNDSLTDLLIENSGKPPVTRLILFKQNSDHSFQDFGTNAGVNIVNPTGSAIFDFDNDGKLDLLVGQSSRRDLKIKERVYLFKNITNNNNKSLKIKLIGPKRNKRAIGAQIVLRSDNGIIQKKWMIDSWGPFPSQHSKVVHFGVGEADKVRVEITWPTSKKKNTSYFIFKTPKKSNFYEVEYKE